MDKLELEFSEANEKVQEYLEGRKDEISTLATDASENTRRRRIIESVAKKSAEQIQKEETRPKEETVDQKETLRELNREYQQKLLQERIDSRGRIFTEEHHYKPTLGVDMRSQLKRVSISVFNGDKRAYEGWKAEFMPCAKQAPATPEHKLHQLRQHLSGEALNILKPLGHSGAAYEAAIGRLEQKCGGGRRKIALHLQEPENIKSLRPGNAGDIEKFANLLDVTLVIVKEAGRHIVRKLVQKVERGDDCSIPWLDL